ncbi:heavy-metal-associated domain-containing protein [Streptomyces sp. 6N223]|uniref:heavy-metal-associated domain-containing protein n=1 Tax=Streptomyces sp. 6N223 TaxID=3457412 RepID=UPI003FD4BB19
MRAASCRCHTALHTPQGYCVWWGEADRRKPMTTTTYKVSGMSCGHCEGAVSSEVSALPGVTEVKATAATGLVTVVSEAPLTDDAVRAAIDEAGYELVGKA